MTTTKKSRAKIDALEARLNKLHFEITKKQALYDKIRKQLVKEIEKYNK